MQPKISGLISKVGRSSAGVWSAWGVVSNQGAIGAVGVSGRRQPEAAARPQAAAGSGDPPQAGPPSVRGGLRFRLQSPCGSARFNRLFRCVRVLSVEINKALHAEALP